MFTPLIVHVYTTAVVVVATVSGASYWHWRSQRKTSGAVGVSEAVVVEMHVEPKEALSLPLSPLLTMPADLKLTQSALAGALDDYCDKVFTSLTSAGDGINIAVQAITATASTGDIVYQFSDQAWALVGSGQAKVAVHEATGKFLPIIQDQSGQIIEQAKGTLSLAPQMAQVVSMVVSAAHLIAGKDLSNRVARLQRSVHFLIAAREIDQQARLASLFLRARRELAESDSPIRQATLSNVSDELGRLRLEWHGEITNHLAPATTLKKNEWWHFRNKAKNKAIEIDILKLAPQIGQKLEWIGAALLIDAMLAFSTGSLDGLRDHVMSREVTEWAELSALSAKMVSVFHDKRKAASSEIARGIARYLELVRQLHRDPLKIPASTERVSLR